jgi:hypothetical protein
MKTFNFFDTGIGSVTVNAQLLSQIMAIGNQWFVNETTGGDSNSGSSAAPFKTLDAALAAATANNGDVVFLQGTAHRTAPLNWNKNDVSLVGINAPSNNGRARISVTGSSVFTPLVNVTANGCAFINFATFHGFNDASAQICWAEAGGRNYYNRVQLLGGGDATAAAQAGMRSLTISSGENLFEDCTLGLDTITRATAANATLEFLSGAPRNVLRRCLFQALVSDASDVHVTVGADGIDRYAYFDECAFMNAIESTAVAMNAAITANASAGGAILLRNPISLGATAIATTGPVYIVGTVPTAATSGIAIKAT